MVTLMGWGHGWLYSKLLYLSKFHVPYPLQVLLKMPQQRADGRHNGKPPEERSGVSVACTLRVLGGSHHVDRTTGIYTYITD